MSRCYPYPPPGYQKKAQLPDVNVPAKAFSKEKKKNKEKEKDKKVKDLEKEKGKKSKEAIHKEKKETTGEKDKEKHRDKKDKNKKEKRKKDGETNGIGHDKDPRSSKLQRTSRTNNVLHSNEENGKVRETTVSAAVACSLGRDGRDAAKPPDSVVGPASEPPSMYIKKDHQPNGKVVPIVPPVVLLKPRGDSPPDVDATPSTRPSNHSHPIDSSSRKSNFSSQRSQKLPDFSICDNLPPLASWSTLDDEDWLFPSSERLHSKPKARAEEATSKEVWAEAVYLSSVDMYALPYVVPY
ncbi:unnamed protein product [Calypogeia fissa]